ncbi:MAG: hypothetical protein HFE77_03240 [Clostridiales bacterium]|nr:hypothetical protein [Clostridiales bacterium]
MYTEYYYCAHCDQAYAEEDVNVREIEERLGECHGVSIYTETQIPVCPRCGRDCEETDPEEMVQLINQQSEVIRRLERKVEALKKAGGKIDGIKIIQRTV